MDFLLFLFFEEYFIDVLLIIYNYFSCILPQLKISAIKSSVFIINMKGPSLELIEAEEYNLNESFNDQELKI